MSTFFKKLNYHWKCDKFSDNPVHNIMKLYNVSGQVRLVTK